MAKPYHFNHHFDEKETSLPLRTQMLVCYIIGTKITTPYLLNLFIVSLSAKELLKGKLCKLVCASLALHFFLKNSISCQDIPGTTDMKYIICDSRQHCVAAAIEFVWVVCLCLELGVTHFNIVAILSVLIAVTSSYSDSCGFGGTNFFFSIRKHFVLKTVDSCQRINTF